MINSFKPLYMPCGGTAYYDLESSCYSYRCATCFAVVGSIGMPRSCKEERDKWNSFEVLGGHGWDYDLGQPE